MSFDSFLFPPLFANHDAFMGLYEAPIDLMPPNAEEIPAPELIPLHEMVNHIEDLAQPVIAGTKKRTADEVEQPVQLAKRRKGIFTEDQDKKIIDGKGAGLSPRAILATLGEGSGFTEAQIQSRRTYLARIHPELQAVLKTKKFKVLELTQDDVILSRYKLRGFGFPHIMKKIPNKTISQLGYRWSQLNKHSPEFVHSVKEQLAKEKQERLVAKFTDEGYSLMQIARKFNPQQQPN